MGNRDIIRPEHRRPYPSIYPGHKRQTKQPQGDSNPPAADKPLACFIRRRRTLCQDKDYTYLAILQNTGRRRAPAGSKPLCRGSLGAVLYLRRSQQVCEFNLVVCRLSLVPPRRVGHFFQRFLLNINVLKTNSIATLVLTVFASQKIQMYRIQIYLIFTVCVGLSQTLLKQHCS